MGHGEWGTPTYEEGRQEVTNPNNSKAVAWNPVRDPEWVYKWRCSVDKDIWLHHEVLRLGYPNRWGARIPIYSKWNLQLFSELLKDYEDKEVVEWMTYGWPSGRLPTLEDPEVSLTNHAGATEHPQALSKYISKELGKEAVMGPFDSIPFQSKIGISPLSTRPKRDSLERRIILDLSFPPGRSINDGIIKDNYLGFQAKLSFPKIDEFACRIYILGKGCLMFKVDLSRYFRQLPLDPGDYSLIGYVVDGKIYFDKVLPMGMRSAPYIAQRVTNAIAYIHRQMEYFLLNYVDDFVGAEWETKAWKAYQALTTLLNQLKVEISEEKLVPPTTRLEFLGITFDSCSMTMEISEEKMKEIKQELGNWTLRTSARRREVESLIGKLQFMAKCIKAGRIFLSRLIQWLRGMDRNKSYLIPEDARKDITWWARCAEAHNGRSLLWLNSEPGTDMVMATDACLIGYGGTMGDRYFRGKFTKDLKDKNIAFLEMLAVMVALKIWGEYLQGKYFWIHVDNEAVATVLNTGASRDPDLQNALREIALIAAKHQFVIKTRHIAGVDNRVPDQLSRWHQMEARREFRKFAKDRSLKRTRVYSSELKYENKW